MRVGITLDLLAKVLSGNATIEETYAVMMARRTNFLIRALVDSAMEEGYINPIIALLFEVDDEAVEDGAFGRDIKNVQFKTKRKSKMLREFADRAAHDAKKN